MKKYSVLLFIVVAVFYFQNCQTTTAPVSVDLEQIPYKKLSEYNFFKGELKSLTANDAVLKYEPITPLFTDYAKKSRFVWMPKGVKASINEAGIIEYPNGAVLIKNFFYPHDFAKADEGTDMVETRLLIKKDEEWQAFTYVWNQDATDAELTKVGAVKAVNWKDENGQAKSVNYIVPNKNQCKSCHQQNTILKPIGTKVRNINSSLKYADGTEMNQLEKWMEVGYLQKTDYQKFPPIADWQDENAPLQARAMAYLEANCAHCHSEGGQARTTGLYLTTDENNPSHLGFCKGPVAAGKGSGGRKVSIHPGSPEKSILLFRMQSNDPGIMMPELGRAIAHTEGVALVESWIASLEKEDCKQE